MIWTNFTHFRAFYFSLMNCLAFRRSGRTHHITNFIPFLICCVPWITFNLRSGSNKFCLTISFSRFKQHFRPWKTKKEFKIFQRYIRLMKIQKTYSVTLNPPISWADASWSLTTSSSNCFNAVSSACLLWSLVKTRTNPSLEPEQYKIII